MKKEINTLHQLADEGGFYERYYNRLLTESDEKIREAKKHWSVRHRENYRLKREDLTMFSRQMLEVIARAEKVRRERTA